MSQEGPQQGDPLGLLLFRNIIHPLLESLDSVLRLRYMDDVTLGGSRKTVAKDVQTVMEVGHDMGLNILQMWAYKHVRSVKAVKGIEKNPA